MTYHQPVLQPALSLVLEALKEIRESQEKTFRVSRATLNRLVESRRHQNVPDIAARAASLGRVRDRVCVCTKCPHLARSRTQTVFGVGNPDAELMFIGEAPGADEDARGEPFVGRAGQLLTDIIERGMGIARADVYICNVIKCRPPDNRNPEPDEVAACEPFMLRQIEIVKPKVIVG